MSYLGFGRKAVHGAPDVGMIVPRGSRGCNQEFRARSMAEALGNCNSSHGGWGLDNTCGDYIRAIVINHALDDGFEGIFPFEKNLHGDHEHTGYPSFPKWPHHSSKLHQQMWWEWVKRAHAGGLRVMVALTVNSETLATVLNGDKPYDDKTVADVQIAEVKRFVARHRDFMEIAYSSADADRIIRQNKLAVVLGMEIDKIGNFGKLGVPTNAATVRAEIQRLHRSGIRYVFPIHLIDNAFGGAAVYEMLFNLSNLNQNGRMYRVMHSKDPDLGFNAAIGIDGKSGPFGWENAAILGLHGLLEGFGHLPAPCMDIIKCPLPPGNLRCCGNYEAIVNMLKPAIGWDQYKTVPPGHVNAKGLSTLGQVAVGEMMRLGMIIDVDHMSELSATQTIEMAEAVPGGYPLVFGHNRIRQKGGNERAAPAYLVRRVAKLGGMFGVGTAEIEPQRFVENYQTALSVMESAVPNIERALAVGTDVDGFEPLPHHRSQRTAAKSEAFYGDSENPAPGTFFRESGIRSKQKRPNGKDFDYILEGGVSHYGLMPEFLHDVKRSGGQKVVEKLMASADYFVNMWRKIEVNRPRQAPPPSVATTKDILINGARYGANCGIAAAKGNFTPWVAEECDGKASCNYEFTWTPWGGDPNPSLCRKEILIDYTCGARSKRTKVLHTATPQNVPLRCP